MSKFCYSNTFLCQPYFLKTVIATISWVAYYFVHYYSFRPSYSLGEHRHDFLRYIKTELIIAYAAICVTEEK